MKKFYTFLIIIILVGLFLKTDIQSSESTSVTEDSTSFSKVKKCYVVTKTNETSIENLLANISVSLISIYVTPVWKPPRNGLKQDKSECIYEVSLEKHGNIFFTAISGEKINSYGDSKLKGGYGIQKSILKGLFRSLKVKRNEICNDFGNILEECKRIKKSKSKEIDWS